MHSISGYIASNKFYIKLFFIYLAIALVMFWIITINITSDVVNGGGDVYQTLFNLWWVPYSIFILHQSPYFTSLLYYPLGANLVTQTLTPLAGIISWPVQIISRALAYNLLFFFSFALSGLFMYLLAEYITKNKYASFIAGLIFAFSPMHIAQSYNHLDWTIIEFVPLYILFYLRTINDKKPIYASLAAISFFLLTFMGDIEQGIMMFGFTVIATILLIILKKDEVANKATLFNLAYMAILIVILSSPFLILIIPNINSAVLNVTNNAKITGKIAWSDSIASYLTPSYYNGLFNGGISSLSNTYARIVYEGNTYDTYDVWERTSYIGYSVLFLVLVAMYYDLRHNKMKNAIFWIAIIAVFGSLSLGPYIQISSFVTNIPTLYTFYLHIPILNIVREPGRFDLLVTIGLAILAAMGFTHITSNKNAIMYTVLFSLLILIEYNGMPLSLSFANSLITTTNVPKIYYQMAESPANFTVLTLPSIPAYGSVNYTYYTGLATYYTSILHKPIISGYVSRENQTQNRLEELIPLLNASTSLSEGHGFTYPSPLITNATNVTLLWLVNFRVGYISVIRSAFNYSEQQQLYSYLYRVFGPPVYQDNSTFVFPTSSAFEYHAGRALALESSGTWIPGYYFCEPNEQCNPLLADDWWGGNWRGIVIFSPKNQEVLMNIVALSAYNDSILYVAYDNNTVAALNLSEELGNYSVILNISKGWTGVNLYEPNSTVHQNIPYINYGIERISVNPV